MKTEEKYFANKLAVFVGLVSEILQDTEGEERFFLMNLQKYHWFRKER